MLQAGNAAGFALSGTVFKLWVDFESIDTGSHTVVEIMLTVCWQTASCL